MSNSFRVSGSFGGEQWSKLPTQRKGSLDSAASRVQIGARLSAGAEISTVQSVRRATIPIASEALGRPFFSKEQVTKLAAQAKSEGLYQEAIAKENAPEAKPGSVTTAFLRAAQSGNLKAVFKLITLKAKGWVVRNTKSIEQEIEKVKASDLRNEAQALEKNGETADLEKARALYEAAAEKKDSTSLYKAAEFYRRGIGGDADSSKAVEFYKKAAEQNSAMAAYELAKCYRNGYDSLGITKDETEYLKYLKQAAGLGNRDALKEYDPIALAEQAKKVAEG